MSEIILPNQPQNFVTRRDFLRVGVKAGIATTAAGVLVTHNVDGASIDKAANALVKFGNSNISPEQTIDPASALNYNIYSLSGKFKDAFSQFRARTVYACDHIEGEVKCGGICPETWRGRLVMHRFNYVDKNQNGVYNTGDLIWSAVRGGGKVEVQFWGCDLEQSLFKVEAPEAGDGIGKVLVNGQLTDRPYIDIIKRGPIEEWNFETGRDKRTGQIRPLPVARFEFRRYTDDWSQVAVDPLTKRASRWAGCVWLCPITEEPEVAHYYVATALSADELNKRGIPFNPNMAIPGDNPKPADWII